MGDRLRLAIGVMGNAASLLLYAAPILTFARVIRRKSTGEFSCIPYILALSNCLLYTWYGLPIVSYRWENFPVIMINGVGILLECSFIAIYFWFTSTKKKIKVAAMALGVLTIFSIIAIVSTFIIHDHHHRKVFVGSIGLVASVAMYGSPLVVVHIYTNIKNVTSILQWFLSALAMQKQVILTKSVEFMPFYLSLFSLLASSLWMAYGLLGRDLFLASPNLVGSPLGVLQLILYCKYRKRGVVEEPSKCDLENNGDHDWSKQLQLVVNDHVADPKC